MYYEKKQNTFDVEGPNGQPRRELWDKDISVKGISVCPNPTSDVLYIDYHHNVEPRNRIDIYDLLGNHVWSQIIYESGANVSIEQLNPGIYILVYGNQSFKIQKN